MEEKIATVGIENCCISEITLAELKFGAYNSTNIEKHLEEVDELLQYLQVLPITESIEFFC